MKKFLLALVLVVAISAAKFGDNTKSVIHKAPDPEDLKALTKPGDDLETSVDSVTKVIDAAGWAKDIHGYLNASGRDPESNTVDSSPQYHPLSLALQATSYQDVETWHATFIESAEENGVSTSIIDNLKHPSFKNSVYELVVRVQSSAMLTSLIGRTVSCSTDIGQFRNTYPLAISPLEALETRVMDLCANLFVSFTPAQAFPQWEYTAVASTVAPGIAVIRLACEQTDRYQIDGYCRSFERYETRHR